MLDVGGGPGTYSALLTERFPGLTSDVLELEGVARIAREILRDMGASDRVTMLDGDYHVSDFGSGYDVVLMSGMFHRETADNCRALIKRARRLPRARGLACCKRYFGGRRRRRTGVRDSVWPEYDADCARWWRACRRGCCRSWMTDAGFEKIGRASFSAADATSCCNGDSNHEAKEICSGDILHVGRSQCLFAFSLPAISEEEKTQSPQIEQLDEDRYRIGKILVDKEAQSFTVPGKILVLKEAAGIPGSVDRWHERL